MIFKYDTKLIGGKVYITGSRLLSEQGRPQEEFEFSKPFSMPLRDRNGKCQWTIHENLGFNPQTDHIDTRYIIKHNPIQSTTEESKTARQRKIKAQLQKEFSDLILQNKDNPENLLKALCDRAKQLEKETP